MLETINQQLWFCMKSLRQTIIGNKKTGNYYKTTGLGEF